METKFKELEVIKTLKNPKAFIDYLRATDNVCENLEGYNLTKKRRVLIVFDDMIADIESNEKLSPINTELFSKRTKPNINVFCITVFIQSV